MCVCICVRVHAWWEEGRGEAVEKNKKLNERKGLADSLAALVEQS